MKSHYWKFFVYLFLLTVGIPWYWPAETHLIVMGLPIWVFVSIIVSIITSIFTAYLLLSCRWDMNIETDE